MKQKISSFLLGFAVLFTGLSTLADGMGGLRNLTTVDTILPMFENGKLQLMLYGREIVHIGGLLKIQKPILDIIRGGTTVDAVKSEFVESYPLRSSLETVFRFWQPRIVFSEAIVFADAADVDQKSQQAKGDKNVFFRSPSMDIDGVGFQADYGKHRVLVKKDVKIIIRSGEADIANAIASGKAPTVPEGLEASSDSMLVDMAAGEVTLIDNVVVDQPDNTIYCDKMLIYLARNGKSDSSASPVNNSVVSGQVSRIVCTGKVRMEAKEKKESSASTKEKEKSAFDLFGNARRAHGDLLFCAKRKKAKDGEAAPAPVKPQLKRPTIESDSSDLDLQNNILTFVGSVKVRDPKLDVDCDKMRVFLQDVDAAGKDVAPGKGRKSIRKIICTGNVKATENRLYLYGDDVTLFFLAGDAKKSARTKGMLNSNSTDLDRIYVLGHLKLVTRPENDPNHKPTDPTEPSILTAEEGTLFLGENRAEFLRDVHVTDPKIELDSERLDVYAVERGTTAPAIPAGKPTPSVPSTDPDEPVDPNASLLQNAAATTGSAPKIVRLSENLELDRVLANQNVEIRQKTTAGKYRHAFGERADYPIREQKILLTGTEEKPPRMTDETGEFSGKEIEVDLARDTMRTHGRGIYTINRGN